MKKLIPFFITFLNAAFCLSQEPTWMWETKVTGNHQANSHNICKDIAYDRYGNVYITGSFRSPSLSFSGSATIQNNGGDCFGGRPCTDGFLGKYHADGTLAWAKRFGGNYEDEGKRIAVDSEGNVYITGGFYSNVITFGNITIPNSGQGGSNGDFYLVKYDSSGTAQWAKRAVLPTRGGGYAVACDHFDNVIVTGTFSGTSIIFGDDTLVNNTSSFADIFIVKYTSAGDQVWAKRAGMEKNEKAIAVTTDNNADIYLAGYTQSAQFIFADDTLTNAGTVASMEYFVLKYSADGVPLWMKGGNGKSDDEAMGICADKSNNIIVSGIFKSDTLFAGNDTLLNHGAEDIFLAKYNSNGIQQWTNHGGDTGRDFTYDVATDSLNNIIMVGFYQRTGVTFDTITFPPPVSPSFPNTNHYVAQFDSSGTAKWVKAVKSIENPFYNLSSPESAVAIGENNSICFAGTWDYYQLIFDYDTLTYALGSVSEIFVSKLGYDIVTGVDNNDNGRQFIYPNPSGNAAIIETQITKGNYHLYDIAGKILLQGTVTSNKFSLDLSSLSSGVYFITIADNETQVVGKVVKE